MQKSSRVAIFFIAGVFVSCAGEKETPSEDSVVESVVEEEVDTTSEVVEEEIALADEESFEARYGTGIVVFNPYEIETLDCYLYDSEQENPFMENQQKVITVEKGNIEDVQSKFSDWEFYAYYLDYDIMHAICLGQNADYQRNLIRVDTSTIYGISESQGRFYSWEEYFKEFAFSVDPINEDGLYEGVIRSEPNDEAEDISEQSDFGVAWVPIEFDGYWMKIEVYEGPCQEGEVQKTGWIKWRDEFKLLVSIAYVC